MKPNPKEKFQKCINAFCCYHEPKNVTGCEYDIRKKVINCKSRKEYQNYQNGLEKSEFIIPDKKTTKTAPKNHLKEDKPMASLIPLDVLMEYLEPAYREGLIKYRRESWREGFHITTMVDSAFRHISDFYFKGEDFDPDAEKLGVKKHHLGGALFSILCMCFTMSNRPDLDDRFSKQKKEMEVFEIRTFNSIDEMNKAVEEIAENDQTTKTE